MLSPTTAQRARVAGKDGASRLVCFERRTQPKRRSCVAVGWLSRVIPDRAIELANQVTARLERLATTGAAQQMGCVQQGAVSVAVMLANSEPTGAVAEIGGSCASGEDGPFGDMTVSLESAVANFKATLDDYQGIRKQCEDRRQGRPSVASGTDSQGPDPAPAPDPQPDPAPAPDPGGSVIEKPTTRTTADKVATASQTIVGHIWRKVVEVMGGNPGGVDHQASGGGPGVRGECLDESQCQSCEAEARTKAIAQALRRYDYDGCNADVMPSPEAPTKTCYNVLRGRPVDKATLRRLLDEACKRNDSVAEPGPDGSFHCRVPPEFKATERSVCKDPRAMCGPDHVDGPTPAPPSAGSPVAGKPAPIPGGLPPPVPGRPPIPRALGGRGPVPLSR